VNGGNKEVHLALVQTTFNIALQAIDITICQRCGPLASGPFDMRTRNGCIFDSQAVKVRDVGGGGACLCVRGCSCS
jgi:hypothetical protein